MENLTDIKEAKKAIRREISRIKKTVPAQLKQDLSDIVLAKVEELPEFKNAGTILLYYALTDEVQTEMFLKKWCKKEKRLVLPVVDGENLILKEYLPNMVEQGYQSILEPTGTSVIHPSKIELAIVPGVAFDAYCNRLGRGKGFYDRLLPHIHCKVIGLGYHFQIVDKIPVESFDRPLDMVITDIAIFS
ncbi:MAG: 5-formyltetrahydrofolate cyclo-ligase [Bacteroidales bacterium]